MRTPCWCVSSVVAVACLTWSAPSFAQDAAGLEAPPGAVPPAVEPEPVEAEVAESAVPSDLATAQWGAIPDEVVDDAATMEGQVGDASEPGATSQEEAEPDKFKLSGRVMAGFQWRDRRPENGQAGATGTNYGFTLRQARVRTELRPNKRLRVVISADFADALDPTDFDPPPYLRNAYLNFAIEKRWLELRVGRFKRAYSRIELRSVSQLAFVGRGLTNDLIVEGAQWGDRAVGAMLRGRVEDLGLRWWLSATNPEWRVNSEPDGLDLLARVQWAATDWLSVGAGGGSKWTDSGSGARVNVFAAGLDARVRVEDLEVMAELLVGQQARVAGQPMSVGVVGTANYRVRVSKNLRVQPTLFGEWTDADIEFSGNDAARLAFGVNLLWKKSFRVMPQLELVRPLGTVTVSNQWPASERVSLIFSGQM